MTEPASLDDEIAALQDGALLWAVLSVAQRARLLERLHATVSASAEQWAEVAATSKGLDDGHPARGEEWLLGPWSVLAALEAYRSTLEAIAEHRSPLHGLRLDEAPGGRVRAHVFPASAMDGMLLSGFRGEVWFAPGVKAREAVAHAGLGQLDPADSGGVGLVLGAGNVSSIPVLDALYELLAFNRVSLVKVNPTQDALVPVLRRALAPLLEAGFVRIVTGGADVGAALTVHPAFSHIHVTGSAATFARIVQSRSSVDFDPVPGENRGEIDTGGALGVGEGVPITAELGGVSPVIVVPGAWSEADLRFQAEHIVTMRLQNSGHNCIAGQVVLLSSDWPQRAAFVAALREAYAAAPERPVWYPGAPARVAEAAETHPGAERIGERTLERVLVETDAADAGTLETTEYFAPVLAVETLPGTGRQFLEAAIAHANTALTGSLGANVLIDPDTQASLGDDFERAIAELRYGSIAVNAWTGVSFTIAQLPWGAFPGGTVDDVGSGIGVVHNALLLDRVERSVLYGPFRPFPRSAASVAGRRPGFTVLPKPPWFVTSRTGAEVSEGLTRYRMTGGIPGLVRTLAAAMRG
jgi:acyl-CoA reductase-like NAD-dependent aldehyde dehydrogenase